MMAARAGTAEVDVNARGVDESASVTAATAVAVTAVRTAMTVAAVTMEVTGGYPDLAVDGPAAMVVSHNAGDVVAAAVVVARAGAGGGENTERDGGGKGGEKELRFHLIDCL